MVMTSCLNGAIPSGEAASTGELHLAQRQWLGLIHSAGIGGFFSVDFQDFPSFNE
jgi:hypothetical protein